MKKILTFILFTLLFFSNSKISLSIEPDVFDHGEKSLGQTIDQDAVVFVFQQYGLRSRGFNGAYFAGQEKRVHRFHEMIESYFRE